MRQLLEIKLNPSASIAEFDGLIKSLVIKTAWEQNQDILFGKVKDLNRQRIIQKAFNGDHPTSTLTEFVVDTCFPIMTDGNFVLDDTPISVKDDPILHKIQTLGRLSNKLARRIYTSVKLEAVFIPKEFILGYVVNFVRIVGLIPYLNMADLKKSDLY